MCENENLISNYWNLCDANPLSGAKLVFIGEGSVSKATYIMRKFQSLVVQKQ